MLLVVAAVVVAPVVALAPPAPVNEPVVKRLLLSSTEHAKSVSVAPSAMKTNDTVKEALRFMATFPWGRARPDDSRPAGLQMAG